MRLSLLAFVAIYGLAPSSAHAQSAADPRLLEFTFSPARGVFFGEGHGEPGFGSYGLGGTITVNLTRLLGVEGEIGSSIGGPAPLKTNAAGVESGTHLFDYNGNLLVSAHSRSPFVPFATAGVGNLVLFTRDEPAHGQAQTYFVGNVGGGVKWFARHHRVGLRADYRFLTVESKEDGPACFGQHVRHGHRVYGAVFIQLGPPSETSE